MLNALKQLFKKHQSTVTLPAKELLDMARNPVLSDSNRISAINEVVVRYLSDPYDTDVGYPASAAFFDLSGSHPTTPVQCAALKAYGQICEAMPISARGPL